MSRSRIRATGKAMPEAFETPPPKDSMLRPAGVIRALNGSLSALMLENDRLRARVKELEARLAACGGHTGTEHDHAGE